ncbi:MAG: hypothetical protein IJS56_05560 [Bacilli bacterium]|nr:hypothetical protein [Bacilli bacterium]
MKRYIRVISLIIIIAGLLIYNINKPRNYKEEYSLDNYSITEEYHKSDKYYSFKLVKDEYIFYFARNYSFSKKRKLIKSISEEVNDKTVCINVDILKNSSETICSNQEEYTSLRVLNDDKKEVLSTYEDVKVYDKSYKYYEWNGYGFTDIINHKEYKILKKENYDNNLSYKFDDYIIFANYDDKNEFKLFYLFNTKTNKFEKIKLKDSISFDSYFQGIYKDKLYIFDKNNSIQYGIGIKNKKVTKTSNSDGALYYDGKIETKPLNTFKYNNLLFTNDNFINYSINNDSLYYSYIGSDLKIKLFDNVQYIIKESNNKVLFLSNGYVYEIDIYNNEVKLLLESMEWEFHYNSQIYIF